MRSFCTESDEQLAWWENIPLLSYILLRGKSRHSGKPISGKYPLIEALTALVAVGTFIKFGLTPTGIVVFALAAALIAITWIDLEFLIIPNVISYPGMTLGLLLGILSQYTGWFTFPITQSAVDSLMGFLVGGGFFFVVGQGYYLATKRVGLGGGDIKLMGMTGAFLGIGSILPTILIGSVAGVIVGVFTIIISGGGRHSEIPFGPWLSLGAAVYMFADPTSMPFAIFALP
jgi:leader peptidase (prepilin peptidase)/N-methyltransferase